MAMRGRRRPKVKVGDGGVLGRIGAPGWQCAAAGGQMKKEKTSGARRRGGTPEWRPRVAMCGRRRPNEKEESKRSLKIALEA